MLEDTRGLKVFLVDSIGIQTELKGKFPLTYNEFQGCLSSTIGSLIKCKIKAEDYDSQNKDFEVNGEDAYNKALEQISGKGLFLKFEKGSMSSS